LLNEYVKPAVENDGGAIDYVGYQDGVVTVEMKGSCAGCPSSTATLKGGIEQLLKSHIQEVKEVVALTV
ncbi:MAG: NifU family protein, partial [Bacteroidota bacterium]